jgi:hypothetical protein
MLRRYTPLGAVVVPDLGLRLVFPKAYGRALGFAVTNPLFKAVRLGPSALLLTVARGSHSRYCGNVFINARRYAVSLLVCTSLTGRHYTSDILFKSPVRLKPLPPLMVPPPLWRPVVGPLAFGHNAQVVIEKQRSINHGPATVVLFVRRFLLLGRQAILGFGVRGAKHRVPHVAHAALYQGRKAWRRVPAHWTCAVRSPSGQVACGLTVAAGALAGVSRWHLIVVTSTGTLKVSW